MSWRAPLHRRDAPRQVSWRLRNFVRVYAASRWLRLRFTPAGRALLILLSAAAVLGLDTRRTMAFQLFALAAAMLALAWLATLTRRRPRVALERSLPALATVGNSFVCRYRVRCHGVRALAGLRLRDELADDYPSAAQFARRADPADQALNWFDRRVGYPRWLAAVRRRSGADLEELPLPRLAPGTVHELAASVTPLRRGTLRFQRSRLLHADPLGLVNGVTDCELPGEVLVLPRVHPVPALRLPGERRFQRGGVGLSLNVGDSQEFVQLRDYRPGDPLRHIHWRSFARRGEPVVKEFQDEYFTRYALVLDTFGAHVDAPSFEAAVSVAASFVAAVDTREALLDLLFVEDRAYRFTAGRGVGQSIELLRVLAAVEPAPRSDFASLAGHVLGQAGRLTACVVVLLGMDAARRELVEQLRRHGLRPIVLAIAAGEPPSADGAVHWVDPDDVAAGLSKLEGPC
jgi:uncharacterized protein (DUF58 family)